MLVALWAELVFEDKKTFCFCYLQAPAYNKMVPLQINGRSPPAPPTL